MRVVFLGSAEFGIHALETLMERYDVRAVVSTPPRPQGRGLKVVDSPVVTFARKRGVQKILIPADLKSPDLLAELSHLDADLFVVIAFRILPAVLFKIPRCGTVNLHASLLPRFRGPAPIHRAVEAGERETGITIFKIDEGIDTGGILLQRSVSIGEQETTPELYERLSRLGAEVLPLALDGLFAGTLKPMQQEAAAASTAPKLKKEEAIIDWRLPAEVIFNKIRAFKPFPGTWTGLYDKRLGIIRADAIGNNDQHEPGTVAAVAKEYFDVTCGRGVLRILEVKPEGKKSMSAHDFLLGTPLREGTCLRGRP